MRPPHALAVAQDLPQVAGEEQQRRGQGDDQALQLP